jgi:hypothetical protein
MLTAVTVRETFLFTALCRCRFNRRFGELMALVVRVPWVISFHGDVTVESLLKRLAIEGKNLISE